MTVSTRSRSRRRRRTLSAGIMGVGFDNSVNTTADGRQAFLILGNSISAGTATAPNQPVAGTAFEFDRNTNTIMNFGAGAPVANYSFNPGSFWARFCINRYNNTGLKPVIVNRGASSSSVSPQTTGGNDWTVAGNNYNAAITAMQTCLSQMGVEKPRAILMGETLINDAQQFGTGTLTVEQVKTNLYNLADRLIAVYGTSVPILFMVPGRIASSSTFAKLSGARSSLKSLCVDRANCHIAGALGGFTIGALWSGDLIHPSGAGYDAGGAMTESWFRYSTYSKTTRSIASCYSYILSQSYLDSIEASLPVLQSFFAQAEFFYSFKKFHGGSGVNASTDLAFMCSPSIYGGWTLGGDASNAWIATNGTSQYFDAGYNQLLCTVNANQNDYAIGVKIKQVTTAAGIAAFAFGIANGANGTYLFQSAASNIIYTATAAANDTYTGETKLGPGHYLITQISGTIRLYKNGVQVDTGSAASSALVSFLMILGARKNDSDAIRSDYINAQFEAFYCVKASVISSNIAGFMTAVDTLLA